MQEQITLLDQLDNVTVPVRGMECMAGRQYGGYADARYRPREGYELHRVWWNDPY